MQELFSNPAIQSAAAPFVMALLLTLVARQFWPEGTGVAVVGGFLTAVALIRGLGFQPLTSEPKIILCGIGLPILMLMMHNLPARILITRFSGIIASGGWIAAILWIIWPVLMSKEGAEAWKMAVPLGLFGMVCMIAVPTLERQIVTVRVSSALLLAIGTGATAMIAASALYSQLAFAIAASVSAVAMFALTAEKKGASMFNAVLLYAALIPLALLAASSTVFAQMPVAVLLCLAFVPVFAWLYGRLPINKPKNAWGDLIVSGLWVSIPLIPAIWLTWDSAGPVTY